MLVVVVDSFETRQKQLWLARSFFIHRVDKLKEVQLSRLLFGHLGSATWCISCLLFTSLEHFLVPRIKLLGRKYSWPHMCIHTYQAIIHPHKILAMITIAVCIRYTNDHNAYMNLSNFTLLNHIIWFTCFLLEFLADKTHKAINHYIAS